MFFKEEEENPEFKLFINTKKVILEGDIAVALCTITICCM
jgi:hypothetical protein